MVASVPEVSVVMPAYNAEKTISESINSVIKQTYSNWELIVINDGSNDNTLNILNLFAETERRIVIINLTKNGGLPNARNEGCKLAKGKYIAFLDSDDLWSVNKLTIQVEFHYSNPKIRISHTNFDSFVENGIVKRPFSRIIDKTNTKTGLLYPGICYRNTIGVLTVMLDKNLLKEVGYFDASMWTLEDQDLWVRIAKENKEFGYIDKILAFYRISPGGLSKKVGRYKKAYKYYIKKFNNASGIDSKMLWRFYYRNFGTLYLDKKEFRLSKLYFWKSILISPVDLISFSTVLYMIYGLLKGNLYHLRNRTGK